MQVHNCQYLPVSKQQKSWGLYLQGCGRSRILADAQYPESGHPDGYAFDWKKGRILKDFQILYLSDGHGVFESAKSKSQIVEAGMLFVLFPEVWHRYKPSPRTGWEENWIGFSGAFIPRLKSFVYPDNPVIRLSDPSIYEVVVQDFISRVLDAPMDRPFSDAGVVVELLGLIREGQVVRGDGNKHGSKIRQAQSYILTHAAERIDFEKLARQFGMSYTSFRRSFKQHTGVSLAQFHIDVQLKRAARWLESSEMTCREMADKLGLGTPEYFSRLFTKRMGCSPREFRTKMKK